MQISPTSKASLQVIDSKIKSIQKESSEKKTVEKQKSPTIELDSLKTKINSKSLALPNLSIFGQCDNESSAEGCGPIPPNFPAPPLPPTIPPPQPKPDPGPALPPCNPQFGSCPTPFATENKAAE